MKTVLVTIGGTLTPGDLLMISYQHPQRGGNSTIKCRVRTPVDTVVTDETSGAKSVVSRGDTLESVAQEFVDEISRGHAWAAAEFRAALRKDFPGTFVIHVSNEFSDVTFTSEVEGAKTETIGLEVLG